MLGRVNDWVEEVMETRNQCMRLERDERRVDERMRWWRR